MTILERKKEALKHINLAIDMLYQLINVDGCDLKEIRKHFECGEELLMEDVKESDFS